MENIVYPSISSTNIESVVWNEKIYNQIMDRLKTAEQEWDEEKFRQMPEPYSSIPHIYKYRVFDPLHPEWTEEIFKEKKLWSPSLESLNDPLEAAFVFGNSMKDHTTADAVKMMMKSNWYGCICLTRDPVCVQMWAHYASCHSGYCIEYYRPTSLLLSAFCRPVLYRRNMPDLTDEVVMSENAIDNLFWTKSEVWEYEAEWRLRYPRANGHTVPGLLKPHGVIFGLRTPKDVKRFIRECAGDIRIGQIVPSRMPYRIRVEWE